MDVIIQDRIISHFTSTTFLEVIIDDKLKRNVHMLYIKFKIAKSNSILYIISQYSVHTEPIFNSLSILNFNNLVGRRISLFMFKYSKNLVPLPIVELFTRSYEFHNYYTRQSQSLHTAVSRKETIYKTYIFHDIRIWNYTSTKITLNVLYASFKHFSKIFF